MTELALGANYSQKFCSAFYVTKIVLGSSLKAPPGHWKYYRLGWTDLLEILTIHCLMLHTVACWNVLYWSGFWNSVVFTITDHGQRNSSELLIHQCVNMVVCRFFWKEPKPNCHKVDCESNSDLQNWFIRWRLFPIYIIYLDSNIFSQCETFNMSLFVSVTCHVRL